MAQFCALNRHPNLTPHTKLVTLAKGEKIHETEVDPDTACFARDPHARSSIRAAAKAASAAAGHSLRLVGHDRRRKKGSRRRDRRSEQKWLEDVCGRRRHRWISRLFREDAGRTNWECRSRHRESEVGRAVPPSHEGFPGGCGSGR